MARLLVWVLIAVTLIGGVIWLTQRDASQPVTRVEKVIAPDATAR